MFVTAHKGNDNPDMTKIIGTSAYVTVIDSTVPEGCILYAQSGEGRKYSVMVVSDYEEALAIKKRLEKI